MGKKYFLYKLAKIIITPIFYLLFRPKIVNKHYIPNNEAIIIVGNHRHAFDPVLSSMASKRNVRHLSKMELFKGLRKPLLISLGAIPVNRDSKDENAKRCVLQALENGEAVGIYPEGKRNKTTEDLLPFKYGAVSFAKKTGTRIVPFAITGRYKMFKNNLKITFGKPLDLSNLDIEEANRLLFETIGKIYMDNK